MANRMLYVLRELIGTDKLIYIYSDNKICHKLKHAKVFKSISGIDDFIMHNAHWASTYKIIVVTEKDLFKAKLADQ